MKFTKIKDASLKTKLTFSTVLIVLISSIVISVVSISEAKTALSESILTNLNNVAHLKADKISLMFESLKPSISLVQGSTKLISHYENKKSENTISKKDSALKSFLYVIKDSYNYSDILLINKKGNIFFSTNEKSIERQFEFYNTNYFNKSLSESQITPIIESKGKYYVYFLAPLFNELRETTGIIAYKYDMTNIFSVTLDYTGLGETGETLLGEIRENEVIYLNPLRHDREAALNRKVKLGDDKAFPIQASAGGKDGKGFDLDYRGIEVIASWVYIPELKWGLVSKIDLSEAYKPLYIIQFQVILFNIIILIISVIVLFLIASKITKPIINLEYLILELGQGKLPSEMEIQSNDEIGLMTGATNKLVNALAKTADFANRIGGNELDADFEPLSSEDVLGKSLLGMREKLKEAKLHEFKRGWATKGLAQFASVLREDNDDLEKLSVNIITGLVKYLKVNQGGLFIINDNKKNPKLELTAMYAYDRQKHKEKEITLGEGLVGQCWQEGERIYITDVPQNYINITSGLGDANASSILLVPLKINDEIYGVIELASFDKLEEYQIEFIEKLAESIASTVSSTKINLNTIYLLQESKEMTEELRAQEEEMRQNMEEMLATQEEMESTKLKMEERQKELSIKESKVQEELKNSQDKIDQLISEIEKLKA